ncbi:MAG TPA: Gfo/Idh/MocA family oxidoreductase, partial [Candidatus Deferrimicrobium sp.]|nr:Gfo/Idh/MocA family oxidoreductase [Candidatus Deferrimicrobium sp.]
VARAAGATPGLSVVAVHDPNRARADELSAATGALVHETLASLLADERVQIVYVAVPHDLLAPIARTALLAGRHVLVEKPMALTVEAIDDLQALALVRPRSLGVFYEMRFAAAAIEARTLVRGGAIGRVSAVRIRTLIDKPPDYWRVGLTGRSDSPWRGQLARAGGGVVLMNTSHQLDLVAAITELSVTSVAGFIETDGPGIDVEDVATAIFRFSNGAIGSLTAGAHVPGAIDDEKLEIDGSLGQLTLQPYSGRLALYLRRPWKGRPSGRWVEPEVGGNDPFVVALSSFVAAARAGSQPAVGAPEARAALATVKAIYLSSAEGRTVRLD